MKYDVFISYSRRDYVDENKQVIPGNVITQIKEMFDANGITYWFDEEGVFSGDAFAPVIARNIKASKIFLFVSSRNSNASEWTSNEIATAHAYKKKIVPFRYDESAYNDSVIMYIARLDYIEHKINPAKALPRLLSSVQSYLKAEKERKERELMEEEQRRLAEISRQEKAEKLKNLRERIETLENRKFEIEKEILAQEKSLADLRNEKRILGSSINELQEEEAALLGHNRKKPGKEEVVEIVPTQRIETQDEKKGVFAREWEELKAAMALKHWSLNTIEVLLGVVAFLSLILSILLFVYYEYAYNQSFNFLFASYCATIGSYSIIKNNRSGFTWFIIATIFASLAVYRYGCEDILIMAFLCSLVLLFYVFVLFIRKNGVSGWQVLKKQPRKIKDDKIRLSFVSIATIFVLIFLGNWLKQDIKLQNLEKRISYANVEELKAMKEEVWCLRYYHPFFDWKDKSELEDMIEKRIDCLKAEERKKAEEAEERKKAKEAEERKKAKEAEERKKAKEAVERKKAEEAEERKKAKEAEERKKAGAAEILSKKGYIKNQER